MNGLPEPEVRGTTETFVESSTTLNVQHRRRTSRHLEHHYVVEESENETLSQWNAFHDDQQHHQPPADTEGPIVHVDEDAEESHGAVRRKCRVQRFLVLIRWPVSCVVSRLNNDNNDTVQRRHLAYVMTLLPTCASVIAQELLLSPFVRTL